MQELFGRLVAAVIVAGCGLLAPGQVVYQLDDGTGNNAGPGSTAVGALTWGNVFDAAAGGEVITSVSVAFGGVPAGQTVTVMLFEDPNDDGDPRDGVLLSCATALPAATLSNTFTTIPITPTRVSGKFYVAVRSLLGATRNFARLDPTPPSNAQGFRTWLFWSQGAGAQPFDGVTLTSATNQVQYTNVAVAMVRAEGRASTGCLADVAGANQSVGADGLATADDVIVFLSWFFAEDARADVAGANQSGCVDGTLTADDIIVFLARFFACT